MQNMKTSRVPKNCEYKGFKLGQWCHTQKTRKKEGTLTPRQIEMLDHIGFEWNTFTSAWERHYGLYKKYVEEMGTSNISHHKCYNGERLGSWVHRQLKYKQEGTLKAERQKKLILINKEFMN